MVAATSKFKCGQSGECQDRTGADEGASGAKCHRTEQGQKAATMHNLPVTRTTAKWRPASPDLLPAVLWGGLRSGFWGLRRRPPCATCRWHRLD